MTLTSHDLYGGLLSYQLVLKPVFNPSFYLKGNLIRGIVNWSDAASKLIYCLGLLDGPNQQFQ